jgi:hypothetical protein
LRHSIATIEKAKEDDMPQYNVNITGNLSFLNGTLSMNLDGSNLSYTLNNGTTLTSNLVQAPPTVIFTVTYNNNTYTFNMTETSPSETEFDGTVTGSASTASPSALPGSLGDETDEATATEKPPGEEIKEKPPLKKGQAG